MNKSESKYYNTALAMNKALLELLDKKDFEYVTIKELCKKAGVNRSTFYLHYTCMNDLLTESAENIIKNFDENFRLQKERLKNIKSIQKTQLVFITDEYLTPFLEFLQNNKIVLKLFFKYGNMVDSKQLFKVMNDNVFDVVFRRFNIDKKSQEYMLAYYTNGIFAIVREWIMKGCIEEIEYIQNVIIACVRPHFSQE